MQQGSSLTNNLMWFGASLALAFFVWLIATTQSDPITQRSFPSIPIQFIPDAGLIVTERNLQNATVNVRAQQSVNERLTSFDITVRAKLQGLGPGTHVVPLEAVVAESRRAVADTRPAQVTVTIEQELREQKPVVESRVGQLPLGYLIGQVTLSESQVLVTGVASKVDLVERLEAPIDLNDRRETFSEEVQLIPVDVDGNRVADVTVAQPVRVTVEIAADEAIEQVLVQPDVDRLSLPSDYVYLGIEDFNPKTVSVTGDEEALANLPDELQTESIDLSGATGTFTTEAELILPEGVSLVDPEQTITVTVLIEPREDFRQINNVQVEVRGRSLDTVVDVVPDEVTVLVRGPQPIVRQLDAEDVQVVVDVQGVGIGNHDLVPVVVIDNPQIQTEDVSVLPNRIGVSVQASDEPSAQGTLMIQPESTAEN
jgi:YbbR domain-containing protein